jgi:hypothetical protein
MVPSRAMRFGGGDVVFRPLVERLKVVSIAAAWNPALGKDVVPTIVSMAADIGADREPLHITETPPENGGDKAKASGGARRSGEKAKSRRNPHGSGPLAMTRRAKA